MPERGTEPGHDRATTSLRRAFVRGLTEPSGRALLLAATVAAAGFLALVLTVTPERVVAEQGEWLAAEPADDYAFVTSDVLALAARPALDDAVVVLGASSMREALSSADDLADEIARRAPLRPHVVDLSTSEQTLWESIALVDAWTSGWSGVLVVGVNPWRLAHDRTKLAEIVDQPRIGFRSTALEAIARERGVEVPAATGNFFLDNRKFYLARLPERMRKLVTGPEARAAHRYHGVAALDPHEVRPAWNEWKERYGPASAETFRDLAALVRLARERADTEIVLLTTPFRPGFFAPGDPGPAIYERYLARMDAFAAEHGLYHWVLDEVAYVDDDFYDWHHLRTRRAQERFTEALATRLAALMEEEP